MIRAFLMMTASYIAAGLAAITIVTLMGVAGIAVGAASLMASRRRIV